MIDFEIVSSDLQPYVLDTRMKRAAEPSTDHHLDASWNHWSGRLLDRPGKPTGSEGELKMFGGDLRL